MLTAMVEIATRLEILDLDLLAGDPETQAIQSLNECVGVIRRIDSHATNALARDDLARLPGEITSAYNSIFSKLSAALSLASQPKGIASEVAEIRESAGKSLAEIKQLVDDAKMAASSMAVAANAKTFDEEATRNNHALGKWLFGVVAAALAILLFCFDLYYEYKTDPRQVTAGQAIQRSVPSVAILSVLYFALVWCARNFRALQHNETVNRHRANSLKTFQVFIQGASSPEVKDAVLTQAAQCIFAPQATGFAPGQEPEPAGTRT